MDMKANSSDLSLKIRDSGILYMFNCRKIFFNLRKKTTDKLKK